MRKIAVPKFILILGLGGFINALGSSLVWPLNSLFMHNVLGKSLTQAGLIIALQSGVALVGQFVSGVLCDRLGARRLMLIGLSLACGTVALIGAFPVWFIYAPAIVFLGLTQAFIFVPLNALITILWPEGERHGYNYLYVANNAGVAIGTALGGLLAQVSFRLVFWSNALTFLLYLLVVLFGLPSKSNRVQRRQKHPNTNAKLHSYPGFKVLAILGCGVFLVWSAYIQLTTVLPVVMIDCGLPLSFYSMLWTLNGVLIVILQPLTSRIIGGWAYTYERQFLLACSLFGGAFCLLLGSVHYLVYLLTMLVFTVGEMLILPTVPTVAAQLAPKGREGTYQGVIAGIASGGRMVGPLLGGMVFDHSGGTMVWVMSQGFVLLAIFAFFWYGVLARKLYYRRDNAVI